MDVWAWLEPLQQELAASGHGHVARMIDEFPYLVQESDPRAEAMGPELIAAARALDNPWLEVYARHWLTQHRVGNNNHGTIALQYVTETLEMAHRPETIDCPQAICTTQDMSMTFESVDRFGYAADREAVCRETIERITPRWNCYDCLHRELCDAVADQGRSQEALDLALHSIRELEAVDDEASPGYAPVLARLHNDLGNPAEAARLCEEAEEEKDDEASTIQKSRYLQWSRACRLMGDFEAAYKHLPTADDVFLERTLSSSWSREVFELVQLGAMENSTDLGIVMQKLLDHSERVGSTRTTVELATIHARLAAQRGIRWLADAALAAGEKARLQLPADHGAAAALSEAAVEVSSVEPLALPVPLDEITNFVQSSDTTLEQDIQWLRQAVDADPTDETATLYLASAYSRAGHTALLLDHVHAASTTDIGGQSSMIGLAQTLLNSDLPAAVVDEHITATAARLIAERRGQSEMIGHRMLADRAYHRDDWTTASTEAELALALMPDAPGTRRLLANASMELKDFTKAAANFSVLASTADEPGSDNWDLITASTCAGDWETVRAQATLLGMDIDPGEGPIDESWAHVGVLLEGFERLSVWRAIRTGPVTARVIEVSHPDMAEQHFGKLVAFNPAPVNQDQKEEAGEDWVPFFPTVHVLEPSTYRSWILDGVHPGDEAWAAFRDTVREDGWGAWVGTWDGYEVQDSDNNDETHPGIFAFVASPLSIDPMHVYHRIESLTAAWPHQLAWKGLATAAEVGIEHHDAIIERYGL
jgi:tetratricopeptide (TPR) repeat protein